MPGEDVGYVDLPITVVVAVVAALGDGGTGNAGAFSSADATFRFSPAFSGAAGRRPQGEVHAASGLGSFAAFGVLADADRPGANGSTGALDVMESTLGLSVAAAAFTIAGGQGRRYGA